MKKPLLVTMLCIAFFSTTAYSKEKHTTVAEGLDSPWAFAFLPSGEILITERKGRIQVIDKSSNASTEVSGVPEVYLAGQGGLLDIMLDQDFASNQRIYLSYAHGDRQANATRLLSAKLEHNENGYQLTDSKVLFTAQPTKKTAHHYGGRIEQMADKTLLLTVGEGYNHKDQAQTLDNHFGKIVRIKQDGSVPKDNPFVTKEGALPEIWSYGHRNQQALLLVDNELYEHEHGPKGGDEINLIQPGINYGWPIATFGIDYSGAQISPYTEYEGTEQPLLQWTPSIAPSGMAYSNGKFYVVSLAEGSIRRVAIQEGKAEDEGIVFSDVRGRLRDIEVGPDGALYVLTDGDNAKLLKLNGDAE